MEIWITEKVAMATEESYKDPSNIQAKHQKHQAFEAELVANSDRINTVLKMGESECPVSSHIEAALNSACAWSYSHVDVKIG